MRNRRVILLLGALAVAGNLAAQVQVEQVEVKKEGRHVAVGFSVPGAPEDMRSRQKMVLRPYLYAGADTLWLPEAQVYGKIRYKRERQEAALAGDREWTLGALDAMGKGDTLEYAAVEGYDRWMRRASLGVAYHYEGCGGMCCSGSQCVGEGLPVYVAPVPVVEEALPEERHYTVVEAKKRWEFRKRNMQVFFPVGKWVLDEDAYGNRETLDEIMAAIRRIMSSGQMELAGVEITGFASPEGGVLLNRQLGQRRAEALRDYVRGEEPSLTEGHFMLVNGVENWDGLRELVAASGMEYRDEVLAILDDEDVEGGRKAALMKLEGGKPYRYMLRELYPKLRNACYIAVYYDVLGDRAADAVNAANGLIREGKYDEALALLLEWQEDARAYNSIGVCYMMLEEEEEALRWFEKAQAAGCPEALENIKQLRN